MTVTRRTAIRLLSRIATLRETVAAESKPLLQRWETTLRGSGFSRSAGNLAAYLALRRHDLRRPQVELATLGLSSLGRCEAHVFPTLDAVTANLALLAGKHAPEVRSTWREFWAGQRLLESRAGELLGPCRGRDVRIMVTLPSTAATDRRWMRQILASGTDAVRINCAHDGPEVWLAMIRNARRAARAAGRRCTVAMDLCGPRARLEHVLPDDQPVRVGAGDSILLCRRPPVPSARHPVQAHCPLPEVFNQVAPGAAVWINEGRLGAVVQRRVPEGLLLRVTHAREKGEKLRAEMALNFPGTDLRLCPLGDKDLEDLDFVVRHADVVGYSFVQTPEDISLLLGELDARRARFKRPEKLGLIAKIETARALRNLPEMIVRAASRGPFGVMIARGDLAIETGYLRVAELQEEILWICEAAHVPVIWATQVLESLAKKGLPTRAELTDAAMSERAECVMLNKGPYVIEAVCVLDEVLRTMSAHRMKKTEKLRALKAWDHLFEK